MEPVQSHNRFIIYKNPSVSRVFPFFGAADPAGRRGGNSAGMGCKWEFVEVYGSLYSVTRQRRHLAFPFRGRWHGEAVTDEVLMELRYHPA